MFLLYGASECVPQAQTTTADVFVRATNQILAHPVLIERGCTGKQLRQHLLRLLQIWNAIHVSGTETKSLLNDNDDAFLWCQQNNFRLYVFPDVSRRSEMRFQ